ncbi:MAG TPA: PepSY-like domain-containing protein [Candidatus Avibacteroides avistercoris]|uniref:PepSY-like domain-containing protein n=1 Tax=Candidatus Avibacteroides avistercoris TaxID=2840690 RepID=A0A9D2UHJ4_9BACT|nr:PepSY-like domain-containing protein [Candidatus Avibacteroides avistercoris]
MKKLLAIVMAMFVCVAVVKADNEVPVTVNELPATAQTFINTHFKDKKVALAKKETGFFELSYDVIFTDGNKLEFDRNGNWKEVNCKYSSVPAAVVPQQISDYVKANYAGINILSIEKDDREYEVRLANRVELTFTLQFQLLDIDMD